MYPTVNLESQMDALKALGEAANPTGGEEQQQEGGEQQQQGGEGSDNNGGEQQNQQQQENQQQGGDGGGGDDAEENEFLGVLKEAFGKDDLEIDFSSYDTLKEAIKGEVEKLRGADPFVEVPQVKEVYDWVKNGGTIEQFQQRPQPMDFMSVAITEDAVELQTGYVTEYLTYFKEMSQEDAEMMANSYKDNGKLYSVALTAQRAFQDWNDKTVSEYDAKIQADAVARETANKAKWEEADKLLTEGFKTFYIPTKELEGFKAFVKPDKNGVSQAAEAHKVLTVEEKLALDYLLYTKFKGVYEKPANQQAPKKVDVKSIVGKTGQSRQQVASQDETLSALSALEAKFRKS